MNVLPVIGTHASLNHELERKNKARTYFLPTFQPHRRHPVNGKKFAVEVVSY